VYSADALQFDFSRLKHDDRMLRIVGNLPYNISTPLIFHLLTFAGITTDMLFMLQKEVAMRLGAKPSTEDYGRLSVMAQYHCEVEVLFDVPPTAFYPPPQVQSSIVRLLPYKHYPYLAHDYALFENIVKQAFGQRRKTLRNSLKKMVNDEIWSRLSIHSDLRAENLSVQDFVEISNACLPTQ
jgi:16S rRNA (adenine1518-N6/adenine1519-N6)-dimethyltransferase